MIALSGVRKFMGHSGQKIGFCPVDLLSRFFGLFEFVFALQPLGDIFLDRHKMGHLPLRIPDRCNGCPRPIDGAVFIFVAESTVPVPARSCFFYL